MDKNQKVAFLKAVKGIPIRWSGWTDKQLYFIPDGTSTFDGRSMNGSGTSSRPWVIWEGFKKNSAGYRWEYVPEYLFYILLSKVK